MITANHGARGAQLLAVSAASIVVWYMAARSLHVSVAQGRSELAAGDAEIAAYNQAYSGGEGDPQRAMAELADRQARVRALSRISGDAARVYESLGTIAASCNVRVDRVEPLRSGARDSRPAVKAGGISISAESTHYVIEAAGEYPDIARFLGALESRLGLSRVVSVRLAPAPVTPGAPPTISASIETAHFRLTENDPAKDNPARPGVTK